MSNQPPVRIAVLGAGPIGLETALYARYLGYKVELLQRGESVAANVLEWGHVPLFSPFGMNISPLGVAAIQMQDPGWNCPAPDSILNGAEYRRRYLLRLSELDLMAGVLQLNTEVVAVGRDGWLKHEGVGDPCRANTSLHILCRHHDGLERIHNADVVIDCTGTYGNHNWLGQSGIPATGEAAAAEYIEYGLPEVTGRDKDRYLGRHMLVIGAGYSAATVVTQLSQLADDRPNEDTRVTWITRQAGDKLPIPRIPNDRLPNRDALALEANKLAITSEGPVSHYGGVNVSAVQYRPASEDFNVTLTGERSGVFVFDRIIANVGSRPDNRIYTELQVHECFASGGPMKLAAQLAVQTSANAAVDCLDQTSCGPESLLNPEPNFYILGSKSYGRGAQFLLSIGFEQIRDLFTIVGGREDLDLYSTMPQLCSE